MQAFIVLGLIPGTNLQIGSILVALLAGIVLVIWLRRYLEQHRQIKQMVISMTERRPLPARAFHNRFQ
jgi:uncharacterized membrane protein YczE